MGNKAVEIKTLSYVYPDGAKALEGVDLDIYEGEAVGIIGPNGAGKTTLLLHLNGLLSHESDIKIFGLKMAKGNIREIRKRVGVVFQDPDDQLFMPTVSEDVAFGPVSMGLPKGEAQEAVKKALRSVDLSGYEGRLSHHLSAGEKKRIAIATVLSMSPDILALDEPSSNLDPRHRRDLINLLNGFTISRVIVTHDLELVLDTCSRTVLLDKGKLIAGGTPREILSDKKLLEAHDLEVPPSLRPSR